MSENVLDGENWKLEAEAVINDVKNHVNSIMLSQILHSTNENIYLNITTIENANYTIELSGNGFRIVGKTFDTNNEDSKDYYETPYSLLSIISVGFYSSFGNELMSKLNALPKK